MQVAAKMEKTTLQRARGAIDLVIVSGKLKRFYQSGSAKIFIPKTYAKTTEAVLVNTAGGLTGGDIFGAKLRADGDTHLTVSTQTAERVYCALGPQAAKITIDIDLGGKASLHWLPQETILFDGAGFSRHLKVEMDDAASFLASEMMVFGRTAMHETVRQGNLSDQWRISRGGRLIHAEDGGFVYDADDYSDDLPFWSAQVEKPHLIVPYTLDTNDMRFATAQGFHTGDQFAQYLIDAFDVLYAEGATAPKMLSIGLHCRLIGRPARFAGLVKFLDHIMAHDKVWVARRIDIANHWLANHPYSKS